ncbi:MAG: TIGR01777 family protein [Nitrospira sp.]|nr:TIGR01777 family protein [bacterium]MBL7048987.1 TIGR01777 family protein [Nitrospira sp.]
MHDNTAHTIAMSGASGFIGTHLRASFKAHKWNVITLDRDTLKLSPEELARKITGCSVVINLAGAPVIHRWTQDYKKELYNSRIPVTRNLVEAFVHMDKKPELLISTSAVGYYSDKGTHTETQNVTATGFLGQLARDWEQEALKAERYGIRTVIFRFGVVLGKDGGALKQMLQPFKLGLGGTIGDGSQAFSWIHIKDLVNAYETVIKDIAYTETYNLTAPNPTTNEGLTHALGHAFSMPTIMQIPRFALKLQYGEGAQILTGGQRVLPERLLQAGFKFTFTDIEEAVKDCIVN